MQRLKAEATADAGENPFSCWPSNLPTANNVNALTTRRVTPYDSHRRSEHSPLTGNKGSHSFHSIKHSSSQPEASW